MKRLSLVLACVALVLSGLYARGQTPPGLITYQARVTDASDGTINNPSAEGKYLFWDSPTAGTLLLTDEHLASGSGADSITNSLLTTLLGSGTLVAGSESTLDGVFKNHAAVYLEVQLKNGSSVFETLTPRVRLVATGYATNAGALGGQVPSFYQSASNLTTGTLADARLSANVALLSGTQTFTGSKTFSALVTTSGGIATSSFAMSSGATAGYVLTSDATGNGTWQAAPGGGGLSGSGANGQVAFWTGTSTLSGDGLTWDNTNKRLGIGTTSPAWDLDVVGVAQISGSILGKTRIVVDQNSAHAPGDNVANTLQFGSGSGEAIGSPRTAGANQYGLDFLTNTLVRMSITNAGDVGVGTTSPASRLDVAGTAKMTGFKLPTGATNGYVLTSDTSGNGTWQAAAGGGAPTGASYVVIALDGSLTSERALASGAGLSLTDGGANGNVTMDLRLNSGGGLSKTLGAGANELGIATGAVTSAMIADGTIANADISSSAAIADTKLATISTAGKVADSALSANVSLLGSSIDLGTSEVAGTLPISKGGTGSTTQNFVDLSNAQTVGGTKTFSATTVFSGAIGVGGVTSPASQIHASIDNAVSNAATTVLTLDHSYNGGNAAAGIGTRINLRTEDGAGALVDGAWIISSLTNTSGTGGSTNTSALRFFTIKSGTMAERMRFDNSSNTILSLSGGNANSAFAGVVSGATQPAQGIFMGADAAASSGVIGVRDDSHYFKIDASANRMTFQEYGDFRWQNGSGASPVGVMKLDSSGNLIIKGSLTQNGTPDVAENIPTPEEVEAGDVVAADPNNNERAIRSSRPYQTSVIGVISTDPGHLLNSKQIKADDAPRWGKDEKPLTLAGRVPVKVTMEGGPIHRGDLLTASSTPGHAMKAAEPWRGGILGTALAEFDGSEGKAGKVLVLVHLDPSPASAEAVKGMQDRLTALEQALAGLKGHAAPVSVALPAGGDLAANVKTGPDGRVWERTDANGNVTRFTYDNDGRIVRKDETRGGTTHVTLFEFGEDGKVTGESHEDIATR